MTLYIVTADVIAYIEAESEEEAIEKGEELALGEWDNIGDIIVTEDQL